METKASNNPAVIDKFLAEGRQTCVSYELLRTPAASEAERGHQPEDKARARGGQVTLSGQINYLKPANLPTPTVADTFTDKLKSSQQKEGSMHPVNLGQAVHMEFGKFADAVSRWEDVTGMVAPAPTKPDGKDGAPRLSSEFTEWMMGLPRGWVTGLGLSRKDELKACGNGVVPQQATLALTELVARVTLEQSEGRSLTLRPSQKPMTRPSASPMLPGLSR